MASTLGLQAPQLHSSPTAHTFLQNACKARTCIGAQRSSSHDPCAGWRLLLGGKGLPCVVLRQCHAHRAQQGGCPLQQALACGAEVLVDKQEVHLPMQKCQNGRWRASVSEVGQTGSRAANAQE